MTGCFSPCRLPADVRSAVYAVGAQTPRGWDFLLSKYRLHSFHLEKNNIEFALSLSDRQDELRWLMDQGLRGDIIRTQDLPHIIVYVAKNPSGYHLAWEFLKENWEKIVEKFELGSRSVAGIVTGVTSRYSTRSHLAQVKEFFGSLEEKSAQLRCVQQAVETIEDNIEWMDRNFEEVKAWLQNNHLYRVKSTGVVSVSTGTVCEHKGAMSVRPLCRQTEPRGRV
ncbi:hypothetical protein AV530_000254 [Patagioenas fasciata monilis]|uniref:ERAP1-like C-terminal domain-containing protein n=1 Tax=Patagioenas fasciata monilis TaxID=372326 RepID=A0A1V4L0U8_PATFA|nr:hypothetical protein AV530_000254 [Patagioenas fasciata monilis]